MAPRLGFVETSPSGYTFVTDDDRISFDPDADPDRVSRFRSFLKKHPRPAAVLDNAILRYDVTAKTPTGRQPLAIKIRDAGTWLDSAYQRAEGMVDEVAKMYGGTSGEYWTSRDFVERQKVSDKRTRHVKLSKEDQDSIKTNSTQSDLWKALVTEAVARSKEASLTMDVARAVAERHLLQVRRLAAKQENPWHGPFLGHVPITKSVSRSALGIGPGLLDHIITLEGEGPGDTVGLTSARMAELGVKVEQGDVLNPNVVALPPVTEIMKQEVLAYHSSGRPVIEVASAFDRVVKADLIPTCEPDDVDALHSISDGERDVGRGFFLAAGLVCAFRAGKIAKIGEFSERGGGVREKDPGFGDQVLSPLVDFEWTEPPAPFRPLDDDPTPFIERLHQRGGSLDGVSCLLGSVREPRSLFDMLRWSMFIGGWVRACTVTAPGYDALWAAVDIGSQMCSLSGSDFKADIKLLSGLHTWPAVRSKAPGLPVISATPEMRIRCEEGVWRFGRSTEDPELDVGVADVSLSQPGMSKADRSKVLTALNRAKLPNLARFMSRVERADFGSGTNLFPMLLNIKNLLGHHDPKRFRASLIFGGTVKPIRQLQSPPAQPPSYGSSALIDQLASIAVDIMEEFAALPANDVEMQELVDSALPKMLKNASVGAGIKLIFNINDATAKKFSDAVSSMRVPDAPGVTPAMKSYGFTPGVDTRQHTNKKHDVIPIAAPLYHWRGASEVDHAFPAVLRPADVGALPDRFKPLPWDVTENKGTLGTRAASGRGLRFIYAVGPHANSTAAVTWQFTERKKDQYSVEGLSLHSGFLDSGVIYNSEGDRPRAMSTYGRTAGALVGSCGTGVALAADASNFDVQAAAMVAAIILELAKRSTDPAKSSHPFYASRMVKWKGEALFAKGWERVGSSYRVSVCGFWRHALQSMVGSTFDMGDTFSSAVLSGVKLNNVKTYLRPGLQVASGMWITSLLDSVISLSPMVWVMSMVAKDPELQGWASPKEPIEAALGRVSYCKGVLAEGDISGDDMYLLLGLKPEMPQKLRDRIIEWMRDAYFMSGFDMKLDQVTINARVCEYLKEYYQLSHAIDRLTPDTSEKAPSDGDGFVSAIRSCVTRQNMACGYLHPFASALDSVHSRQGLRMSDGGARLALIDGPFVTPVTGGITGMLSNDRAVWVKTELPDDVSAVKENLLEGLRSDRIQLGSAGRAAEETKQALIHEEVMKGSYTPSSLSNGAGRTLGTLKIGERKIPLSRGHVTRSINAFSSQAYDTEKIVAAESILEKYRSAPENGWLAMIGTAISRKAQSDYLRAPIKVRDDAAYRDFASVVLREKKTMHSGVVFSALDTGVVRPLSASVVGSCSFKRSGSAIHCEYKYESHGGPVSGDFSQEGLTGATTFHIRCMMAFFGINIAPQAVGLSTRLGALVGGGDPVQRLEDLVSAGVGQEDFEMLKGMAPGKGGMYQEILRVPELSSLRNSLGATDKSLLSNAYTHSTPMDHLDVLGPGRRGLIPPEILSKPTHSWDYLSGIDAMIALISLHAVSWLGGDFPIYRLDW